MPAFALRWYPRVAGPMYAAERSAAAIKAEYADAFAVATAVRHDGELWTGDPELLVPDAPWHPVDLRA